MKELLKQKLTGEQLGRLVVKNEIEEWLKPDPTFNQAELDKLYDSITDRYQKSKFHQYYNLCFKVQVELQMPICAAATMSALSLHQMSSTIRDHYGYYRLKNKNEESHAELVWIFRMDLHEKTSSLNDLPKIWERIHHELKFVFPGFEVLKILSAKFNQDFFTICTSSLLDLERAIIIFNMALDDAICSGLPFVEKIESMAVFDPAVYKETDQVRQIQESDYSQIDVYAIKASLAEGTLKYFKQIAFDNQEEI